MIFPFHVTMVRESTLQRGHVVSQNCCLAVRRAQRRFPSLSPRHRPVDQRRRSTSRRGENHRHRGTANAVTQALLGAQILGASPAKVWTTLMDPQARCGTIEKADLVPALDDWLSRKPRSHDKNHRVSASRPRRDRWSRPEVSRSRV